MRKTTIAILALLLATTAFLLFGAATIPQKVTWNVEHGATGASDSNGGGFDTTTGLGTNYSISANLSSGCAAKLTIDNSAVTATINGSIITFTGSTYTPSAADKGNIVNILLSSGGTGPTPGRYEITGFTSTTWTTDRPTGAVTSTITSALMGGCLDSVEQGILAATGSGTAGDQVVYVRKATYQITTALTGPVSPNPGQTNQRVIGYNSTQGDTPTGSNRPTIAAGTGAGIHALDTTAGGWKYENIIFDGTATSGTQGTIGINLGSASSWFWNVKVMNFSAECIKAASYAPVIGWSEITGCTGTNGAIDSSGPIVIRSSYVHDNAKAGYYANGNGGVVTESVFAGNQDGILLVAGSNVSVQGNLFYNQSRDGIRSSSGASVNGVLIVNNLFAKNAGKALDWTATPVFATVPTMNYNGTYNNGGSTTQSAQYAGLTAAPNDVNCTVNPFTNDTGTPPDYTLNATLGGGASLRAAGFPGVLPLPLTALGYRDIGPYQHADPTGAAAGTRTYSIQ